MFSQATLFLLATGASASPMLSDSLKFLESRQQSCPNLHVFGARETTVPQSNGFGSSGPVVDMILAANPGATKEQIIYPATGGNSYGSSAQAGVLAVTNQVTNFSTQCPDTMIVLVGYSQGAQIMDDAMCGGGDPSEQIMNTTAPISATIAARVKAIILMGDPRHTPGAPYNVGNSTDPGVSFHGCKVVGWTELRSIVCSPPKWSDLYIIRRYHSKLLRRSRSILQQGKRSGGPSRLS